MAHRGFKGGRRRRSEASSASKLLPAMLEVRKFRADALEGVVADDIWPLPTYQEMLFMK
jgi:glutamine synthetase